jgi:hypothetical protein
MITRGRGLAILLVIVVLGAGCLSNGGATVSPETVDYPDGYAASGVTNTSVAIDTHRETMEEPYRVSFTVEQISDRGRTITNGTIWTDPDGHRALTNIRQQTAGTTDTYAAYRDGSTIYQKRVVSDTFQYDVRNDSFERPVYPEEETFESMLGSLTMNATTVTTTDNATLIHYRVVDVAPTRMQTETENANGTMVVDTSGRIRSLQLTFDQRVSGIRQNVTFQYTTAVGNVSVNRPGWLETARESES